MRISTDTAELIGAEFADCRTDYSGRGMYGANCFAIVTDDAWAVRDTLQRLFDTLDLSEADEVAALNYMFEHTPHEDSMGRGTVLYWPGLVVGE